MKSSLAVRGKLTAVAFLASAGLFFLCFGATSADALSPKRTVSGNATFVVGNGAASNALKKSRGRFQAIAPAKGRKVGKRLQFRAPVRTLNIAGATRVGLRGGLRIKAGKRKIALTGLNLAVGARRTVIKGKLGGRTVTLFNAAGKSNTSGDTANSVIAVKSAKLTLTRAAASRVRRVLKLKRLPAGQIGTFSFFGRIKTSTPVNPCIADPQAPGCPVPVDPYLSECGVAAASWKKGTLPAAAPLPVLTGEIQAIESPVTWGIKSSLRSYLSAPFGRLLARDGATANPSGGPFPAISGWTFPAAAGQYSTGSSGTFNDDKAIINGTGSALFCHSGQFRVLLSNPTIVLDGANSRLIADMDTNNKGVWTTTQRIDFADLDVSGIVPDLSADATNIVWNDVPASLTASGSEALGLCDAAPGAPEGPCSYGPGTDLDKITFGVDTGNPVALCSMTATAGFSAPPTITPAKAVPVLSPSTATTGGSLEWGFRDGLRRSVQNSGGSFGLANGALRSDPANMGEPAPADSATRTTKFFTWPSVEGDYESVAAGDDRLVIKGKGNVSFCNPNAGGYGLVISNPTVVIDGADSLISADVAIRTGPDWASGRVDVVKFDLSGVDPTADVGTTETQLVWEVEGLDISGTGPAGDPRSSLLKDVFAGGPAGFNWLKVKASVVNEV